tara:strand:- start:3439 stop:3924 length:486 start_codon:yes stop_codon:yes gene_type:complete
MLEINKSVEIDNFTFPKPHFFKDFFTLNEEIDFNKTVFYLDFSEKFSTVKDCRIEITTVDRFDEIKSIQDKIISYFKCPNEKINTNIYASLNKFGVTKTHVDVEGVFLLCTFGKVIYNIYSSVDNFDSIFMKKGDLLYIPSGFFHSAIPLGPRVIVSIGIF